MDWVPKVLMMAPKAHGPKLETTIYTSEAFTHFKALLFLWVGAMFFQKW
jgi:hypothetical protein